MSYRHKFTAIIYQGHICIPSTVNEHKEEYEIQNGTEGIWELESTRFPSCLNSTWGYLYVTSIWWWWPGRPKVFRLCPVMLRHRLYWPILMTHSAVSACWCYTHLGFCFWGQWATQKLRKMKLVTTKIYCLFHDCRIMNLKICTIYLLIIRIAWSLMVEWLVYNEWKSM